MKTFTKTLKSALLGLFLGAITLNATAQDNVLDFDGINDYVEFPYSSGLTPGIFSVQFWVKANSTGKTQAIFMNGGILAGAAVGFGLYDIGGNWTILYGNGGASFSTVTGPAINYGTWTNIAGTYNGTQLKLYVDGVLVSTTQPVPPIQGNPQFPIRLGAGTTGVSGAPNDFFSGQLDNLSMWNTTIPSPQITGNMNHPGLTGTEPFLSAYYSFNEGIANGNNATPVPGINSLIDKSANHFNGTLNNFALTGSTSNWVGSDNTLPITLSNFSGVKKDGSNLLQWSTASEQNSAYFEIQRSDNGTDFTAIAKVNAAGNSSITKNYQYSDNQLSTSSVYYYRLKMVDIDGSAKFSSIIFIRNSNSGVTTVYPNPARDQITINIADKSLINTQALLSDLNGKILQRISLTQASTQVNISNYVGGMYLLKFKDGSTIKIVKE